MHYEEWLHTSRAPTGQSNEQHRYDRRDRQIRTVHHHPVLILVTNKVLEGLVISNINWLSETSTAWRDDNDLTAEVIDGAINRTHLMDTKAVEEEERDNSRRCGQEVRLEAMLHPEQHQRLTHPSLFLSGIQRTSRIQMSFLVDDFSTLTHLFAWMKDG